jgi:hypothetical protein
MNKLVSCVVRLLGNGNELVRIEDSFNHQIGERVVSGWMEPFTIKSGPSGSHRIEVWSPRGVTIVSAFGDFFDRSLEERIAEAEAAEAARTNRANHSNPVNGFAPTSKVSCVVRSFNGQAELVRIEDSFNHVVGERVLTGAMTSHFIKSGPSGSHSVRVWSPRGRVEESQYGLSETPAIEVSLNDAVEVFCDMAGIASMQASGAASATA